MIPKILHFIWFGKIKVPQKIIDSWKSFHKDYDIKVWNEENLFVLENQKRFDKTNKLNEKSDIARYEILYNYGGFYIDCDILCLKNIDDLLNNVFFCLYEKKKLISNSIIGCEKKNKIIKKIYKSIPENIDNSIPVWKRTGPLFFTNIINKEKEIEVYPHYYFNFCRDYSYTLVKDSFIPELEMKTRKNKDIKNFYDKDKIYGIQLWMGSKKHNYENLEKIKNETIINNLNDYLIYITEI